ncbi:hybrid sensor histidine kinase/response regulator [Novosphingobium sp.]|uniref:hybrid sensor histidine kinase/response regulator n=1 Tax=Novosphingobium sp. TaxID=1874826 RepID=UPI0025ED6428|nr:hybrid sensor histidine kinase/response regulator [Novosphingobium sp.]MCC6925428.1 hybrid sensor histidine kinase/response regulator [Novosphingobium sp.]
MQTAELGQARVRVWFGLICASYIVARWAGLGQAPLPDQSAIHLLAFTALSTAYAAIVFWIVKRFPVDRVGRKFCTLLIDMFVLTYTMAIGGEPMMLIYALLVGVIIGNGMRYGVLYMAAAAILAQVSLSTLALLSPFWRANPELVFTFSITAIVLPSTALALLRQTAKARDAALEAMQVKSRFLAQASHDLRQPIHAIGYYLGNLRESTTKAEREGIIDRIDRALDSVSGLFKSLLDVAQLDSGTIAARPEPTRLGPLLAEIVQQNEQSAHWHDVRLRLVPTTAEVMVDPVLLSTMIQNLVSNAIKHARGSSVLIGVRRTGQTVSIEVHDQGIGIEEAHLPHIFTEFYRAHMAGDRDVGGVGLGLNIVDRLARLCGMRLELQSRRGVGTVVRIALIPRTSVALDTAAAAPQPTGTPLSGMRIILIEDDQDVLEGVSALMARWGCQIQPFLTIPATTELADLIIADYDLGNGQLGIAAIHQIRSAHNRPIPAFLMTGHSSSDVEQLAAREGVELLTKPVHPAQLRSMLATLRLSQRDQVQGLDPLQDLPPPVGAITAHQG